MSVKTQIERIESAKEDIAAAITEKGVSVPDGTKIDEMAAAIGNIETPTLQEKTVTPSTSAQTVTPDAGYNGLSEVTVAAVPTETKSVTANGTYTPTSGKFFSSVTVAIPTYDGTVS